MASKSLTQNFPNSSGNGKLILTYLVNSLNVLLGYGFIALVVFVVSRQDPTNYAGGLGLVVVFGIVGPAILACSIGSWLLNNEYRPIRKHPKRSLRLLALASYSVIVIYSCFIVISMAVS